MEPYHANGVNESVDRIEPSQAYLSLPVVFRLRNDKTRVSFGVSLPFEFPPRMYDTLIITVPDGDCQNQHVFTVNEIRHFIPTKDESVPVVLIETPTHDCKDQHELDLIYDWFKNNYQVDDLK